MRAVQFYGIGDLRVEEVPDPVPGPGDVLVQVEVALTDGTDLKTYRQGHPVLLSQVPSPFGHEFCGIEVSTGRRVVAANSGPCGTCAACVRGDEPLCDSLLPFLNGAYAELLVVPERIARTNLLPVPDGLAPEIAALVEPLACCIRGVERAGIEEGQTVAVLGAGPIGLMLCACIADAGAHPVLVGGRPERRALAPEFGAVPGNGRNVDVAIEATGSAKGWGDAVALVRPGGTAVIFSGLPGQSEVPLDAYRIHYQELIVRGSFHHTPRGVRAALVFLASGARPWRKLLTHEVSLENLPVLFADPPRDYLKAVVRP